MKAEKEKWIALIGEYGRFSNHDLCTFSGKMTKEHSRSNDKWKFKSNNCNIELSANTIKDSQLQMLFAICYPSIPEEVQIGLAFRILCDFGIQEIADAFLTNKETINKRLFRAKEKWENILQLYNQLLVLEHSPIAALNRTYALAKVHGNCTAIVEAEKLGLSDNYDYFILLGELYKDIDQQKAKYHLQKALILAKTTTDKQTITTMLAKLNI